MEVKLVSTGQLFNALVLFALALSLWTIIASSRDFCSSNQLPLPSRIDTPQPQSRHKEARKAPGLMPLTELTRSSSTRDLNCSWPFVLVEDRVVPDPYAGGRKIPRYIHISQQSRCLHYQNAKLVQLWKDKLPGYSVFFHDDDAVDRLFQEDFPEFPHLRKILNCIRMKGAMKIDVWRILVLYKYGGIYSDADVHPGDSWGEDTILPTDEAFFPSDAYNRPCQWLFALAPRHPIAYYTMAEIISRVLAMDDINHPKVVMTTGPDALKHGFAQAMGWGWSKSEFNGGLYTGNKNRTARIIRKRQSGGLGWNAMDQVIVYNSTFNMTVKDEIGMDTGMLHWTKEVEKLMNERNKSQAAQGSCLDYLYMLDSQTSAQ